MDTPPEAGERPGTLRRVLLVGGLLAVIGGLLSGLVLMVFGRSGDGPPPAMVGGLVVESGPRADSRLAAGTRLRCYVEGQFVGDLTLELCARRNGVASGALDVGIDPSGALGAGAGALTPLPSVPPAPPETAPVEVIRPSEPEIPKSQPTPSAPQAACWRHTGSDWRRLPGEMTQSSCVQTLFAGRCERPGEATYGRWGAQTLRLVPGRVEVSGDNRTFRTLVEQSSNCSLSGVP
jgi:hypothetical protein